MKEKNNSPCSSEKRTPWNIGNGGVNPPSDNWNFRRCIWDEIGKTSFSKRSYYSNEELIEKINEGFDEFIRRLKERIFSPIFDSSIKTQSQIEDELIKEIDRLAGDKLR